VEKSKVERFQREILRGVYPEREILGFLLFAALRVRMTSEGLRMTQARVSATLLLVAEHGRLTN
jgi:hypothetical protein